MTEDARVGARFRAPTRDQVQRALRGTATGCALLLVLVVPLAFDPTRHEVFAPVKVLAAEVLLGLGLTATALALLVGPPVQHQADRPATPVAARVTDVAVACFAGANVLAYLHSLDRASSLRGQYPEYQGLVTVLGYVAAYALARSALHGARQVRALFAVLTAVAGLVGGYAVLQRFGLDPLWGRVLRPFGTVGLATSLAAVIVVALPAAVATVLTSRRVGRAAALVAGLLGLAALAVSLSRGGWLAAAVAVLAAVALTPRPHRVRAALVTVCLVGAVGAALLASPVGHDLTRQVVARANASQDTDRGSVGVHLALAEVGVLVTADHPWLGVGQDVFPLVAQTSADRQLAPERAALLRPYRAESPHNGLLEISCAAGIPAALAYLVAVAGAAAVALRNRGRITTTAVTVALLAHLVSGMFMSIEVSSQLIMWTLLGVAVSSHRWCEDFPVAATRR